MTTTREKAIEAMWNTHNYTCSYAEAETSQIEGVIWNRKYIARYVDALISTGLLPEWRPISEARKDGTEYQLWCSGRRYVGSWRVDASIEEHGEPEWLANDHDDWSTGHCSTPIDPTLFMPLPAPPEQG